MKLINAYINPNKRDQLKEKLNETEHHGLTITEVAGYGNQKGDITQYRGAPYTPKFLSKIKVEIMALDRDVEMITDIILVVCQSKPHGELGDGKIAILPLEDVIRIRTGERGEIAI